MTPAIKHAIENGKLVLLLGAGASADSLNRDGKKLRTSDELAEHLAAKAGFTYSGESLPVVYAAVKARLGDSTWPLLEECFGHCRPSKAYNIIASFPWPRVYTLNIDDALEAALRSASPQRLNIRYRFDRVKDRHPLYEEMEYVKLNGCVHRQADGVIFSPQEYGAASAFPPLWYQELAEDYFRYVFLFIGTRLNEPIFFHQIERHRASVGAMEGTGYVITREATEIEKQSLESLRLQHISGTVSDFAEWLNKEFPKHPTPWDFATTSLPQLKAMVAKPDQARYAALFEQVLPVRRELLAPTDRAQVQPGQIRDFYRGFKPTWQDLIDGVPAELDAYHPLRQWILSAAPEKRMFLITGPAGSGKTTALMALGLWLCDRTADPVYFLLSPTDDLGEALEALEASNEGRFFFLVDRISQVTDEIKDLLTRERLKKCVLVCTERQNVWVSRIKGEMGRFCAQEFRLSTINEAEAKRILEKLEQFGPWTRLGQMPQKKRVDELLQKAKRQLLIGLLEATSGVGFESIIANDYETLPDDAQKGFVLLVGLGTIHRVAIPEVIVSRASRHLGIPEGIDSLLTKLSGVVHRLGDALVVRHPVYVEHLFETTIGSEDKQRAIHALLAAYTVYPSPIRRYVTRGAGQVFKFTLNHRFLKNTFDGDESMVLGVYKAFQKNFENDGLFWLQFGLALRDQGMHLEAMEKLKTAVQAYRISHTEHAYAQQLLILAVESESRTRANSLVAEAKEILLRLDATEAEIGNAYPIVTLSELHTAAVRRHDGEQKGCMLANQYVEELKQRLRKHPEYERIKKAKDALTKYAATGVWEVPSDQD
ncbi:MAG TPA: SIR2 family protein [Accumulibacter sp.]|uniref:P-loop NTPase n=1 Tax=Accumulibacter sp. TaxID=2053492 RepID=UPI0025E85802|nr:SIR2 family protein [Accumulibacter sp.]MCM8597136.1 SIR2 family protein [Accumulibacter sp.]MCM8664294.1 SIR2 family protein [Accumulibacter sp.]HNC53116.1 SIR2 family protein [Accumulibacter sp.]